MSRCPRKLQEALDNRPFFSRLPVLFVVCVALRQLSQAGSADVEVACYDDRLGLALNLVSLTFTVLSKRSSARQKRDRKRALRDSCSCHPSLVMHDTLSTSTSHTSCTLFLGPADDMSGTASLDVTSLDFSILVAWNCFADAKVDFLFRLPPPPLPRLKEAPLQLLPLPQGESHALQLLELTSVVHISLATCMLATPLCRKLVGHWNKSSLPLGCIIYVSELSCMP
jgi:hypothetical protein